MGSEIDLVLYGLSVVVLTIYAGAITALEILSHSRYDRGPQDTVEEADYVSRFLDDAIRNGISLGIARSVAATAVVAFAIRLANLNADALSLDAPVAAAILAVASLVIPVAIARIVAVQGGANFLLAVRVFVIPATIVLRPLASAIRAVFDRLSPTLLELVSFQVIPLKKKIEILGGNNGDESDEERRIMSSVLDFGETRVREVMVPRIDVVAVNADMQQDEALELIMEAGHSRIPVYEETIDNIVGTLYTKDLLRQISAGEDYRIPDLVRRAFFVPESKMIDDLLAEFRSRRQHLAIVVDEYGGTAGIVTMEDILEELVGDIQDEFDSEDALLNRIDDDTVVGNAKMRIEDLNEALGIELPDDESETLGGLLYQEIGRIPRKGDSMTHGGLVFEIESVERQRIENVRISGLSSLKDEVEDNAS